MSETLEGQTVLGNEDSPVLSMRQTLPFSWMEQSMTPQMNFMQQPTARLSSIRFADEIAGTVRYAGPKFMQAVFEDLDNNDVGVVPNEDFSSYYVVQVLDRTPADRKRRRDPAAAIPDRRQAVRFFPGCSRNRDPE